MIFGTSLMQAEEIEYLVRNLPPAGSFLEVGAFEGASACRVLEQRPDLSGMSVESMAGGVGNSKYTVDTARRLFANVAAHRYRYQVFLGELTEFARLFRGAAFDCLIVDGGHDEASAYRDLSAGENLVNARGWLHVHDYATELGHLKGVRRAVDRFTEDSAWRVSHTVGLSAILRRI